MLNFRDFLIEARSSGASDDKQIHLPHPSSFGHLDGEKGTGLVMGALQNAFKSISKGQVPQGATVKVDGAPAVDIEGPTNRHPLGTVATKTQAVAKNPKINASHEDIDANYPPGEKLGLNEKLKSVHDAIPNFLPQNMKVKADIMHGGGKTVHTEMIGGKPHLVFSSNLVRYAVPADSPEAERIRGSKIGLAVHGIYDEHGKIRAVTPQDMQSMGDHPDVHLMSVFHDVPPTMTPEQGKKIAGHLKNAQALHNALAEKPVDEIGNEGPSGYDMVTPHGLNLETYVNHTIRNSEPQHLEGFVQWLKDRGEKEAGKVVTDAAKARKREAAQAVIGHVMNNQHHFKNALALQQELEGATNTIADTMNATHHYRAFIGDHETGPEGHYINHRGVSMKIVRRRPDEGSNVPAFAQANLQGGRFQKQQVAK